MIDKRISSAYFTIFIVDAAESSRSLLESVHVKEWRVESFASAESCLARLNQFDGAPNLLMLDVDSLGMDGFALCRQIKQRQCLERIPVVFVSGLDDLESRLEGFEAGGLDFLCKPFSLIELKQKIGTICRISCERQLLNTQLHESKTPTSLILTNLDECAALIRFLRALNGCEKPQNVADELLNLFRAYQLQCIIQLHLTDLELTISESGTNQPLEISVINHVQRMGSIYEIKRRVAFNFEHISILVNNVQQRDPELCGHLRDHVAIVAECANARLQAVQIKTENARANRGMLELLEALKAAVQAFEEKYTLARYRGSVLALDMISELTTAFTFLGISGDDAHYMLGLVHTKAKDLSEICDFSSDTLKMLDRLAKQLTTILESARDQDSDMGDLV